MSVIPFGFGSRIFDDLWDPFTTSFFPSFSVSVVPRSSSAAAETDQFVSMRIDWKETPESHVFKVDLPGMKKEEVKVEIEEGNVLKISGERKREEEGEGAEKEKKESIWHRMERGVGKFLRRFRLPDSAKTEEVKATMEDGVLTVTVPKAEVKKPEVKSIDIK